MQKYFRAGFARFSWLSSGLPDGYVGNIFLLTTWDPVAKTITRLRFSEE
jgi:hypothetical protein